MKTRPPYQGEYADPQPVSVDVDTDEISFSTPGGNPFLDYDPTVPPRARESVQVIREALEVTMGGRQTEPQAIAALDRLAAALERAERERDRLGNALARERARPGGTFDEGEFQQWQTRAEKAERALAEIELSEPDWAKGVDENCETLRSIARAALEGRDGS